MAESLTIKEFLLHDPLAKFDREVGRIEVNYRFAEFFPDSMSSQVVGALLPFASERPWKYWDLDTVLVALQVLESDKDRTIQAVANRRLALDRGIDNLFRPSKVVLEEESLNHGQSQGFVRLATEFFPEYLRWAEHVFGNLIEVYWSIKKKGGVEGSFDLRKAKTLLTNIDLNSLLNGYSDRVRNAIAHGEFNFTGLGIEFGEVNPTNFTATEFLRLFDELCRTSNGLGIAIILFWARNNPNPHLNDSIPLTMISRFAAGGMNRTGLKLVGIVESDTPLGGHQLHAAVEISMRSRTQVLGECCRIATHLLEAGAKDYDRLLIELDHGIQVNSLAIVLPNKLRELLNNNSSLDRLPEVFAETQLLWFDESRWRTRLRAWHTIIKIGLKRAKLEMLNSWRESGLWIGKGRFQIREIENLGSQGIARLRIRAILKDPSDAKDEQVIKEIIHELVKIRKGRFVKSRSQFLDSGIPWRKRPDYIFVDLFEVDGTLRWLRGGGWQAGNLVAVAEYVRRNRKPTLLDNPEEIYKNIRIRYSMDDEKARQALGEIAKFLTDIYKDRIGKK